MQTVTHPAVNYINASARAQVIGVKDIDIQVYTEKKSNPLKDKATRQAKDWMSIPRRGINGSYLEKQDTAYPVWRWKASLVFIENNITTKKED